MDAMITKPSDDDGMNEMEYVIVMKHLFNTTMPTTTMKLTIIKMMMIFIINSITQCSSS